MTQALILTSFAVYLLIMLYVGYYYSRQKTANSDEFYLGGRQLGSFVAAMSAEASDMSSWLSPAWLTSRVWPTPSGRSWV